MLGWTAIERESVINVLPAFRPRSGRDSALNFTLCEVGTHYLGI